MHTDANTHTQNLKQTNYTDAMVPVYNPSTQEAEVGYLPSFEELGLHSKTLSPETKIRAKDVSW